jgi:16S rRNA (uracil1498-N3)-methyltransferase
MVELFDGLGFATSAEVAAVGRDRVELRPVGVPLADRVPPVQITLATALPKGERCDWLVEKATELGIARLVPLRTERSVVDPRAAKLDRLRRLVIEASKQCGRNRLMALDEPVSWSELLRIVPGSLRYLAHPGGLAFQVFPAHLGGKEVCLAVGPEGGFSDEEVAAAREAGWCVIGLGVTLLRIETAALVGCARLLALGDPLSPEEQKQWEDGWVIP